MQRGKEVSGVSMCVRAAGGAKVHEHEPWGAHPHTPELLLAPVGRDMSQGGVPDTALCQA